MNKIFLSVLCVFSIQTLFAFNMEEAILEGQQIGRAQVIAARKNTLSPAEKTRIEQMKKRMDAFTPLMYADYMAKLNDEQIKNLVNPQLDKFVFAVLGPRATPLTERQDPTPFIKNIGKAVSAIMNDPAVKKRNVDATFNYSSLINENTQALFFVEEHMTGVEDFFASAIKHFKAKNILSVVASEHLFTNQTEGLKRFNKTGDLKDTRVFQTADSGRSAVERIWLKEARSTTILPLEEVYTSACGINFAGQIPDNKFTRLILEWGNNSIYRLTHDKSGDMTLYRNIGWAEKIEENIKQNKILLAHMGAGHAVRSGAQNHDAPSLTDILEDKKINTITVFFVKKDLKKQPELKNIKNIAIPTLAAVPEKHKKDFPFDYVVYMP